MGNQEKKTSYNPDSGLSLKAAIRHYSDPGLWFEYLTFAAPARSLRALLPRARALLKDNHPELRDFKKNQLWKKFRGDLEARLHSGELIIIGFVAPVPLDGKPERIPKDKVRILTFDYNASSASTPGLEIVGIRVLPSETTNQKTPLKERGEEWAERLEPAKNKKGGYRAAAKVIAREQGLDHLYIEREARAARARKRESGENK